MHVDVVQISDATYKLKILSLLKFLPPFPLPSLAKHPVCPNSGDKLLARY